MSYGTAALSYQPSRDLRLTWVMPALTCLGGGVLFALTTYIMIALPGLID